MPKTWLQSGHVVAHQMLVNMSLRGECVVAMRELVPTMALPLHSACPSDPAAWPATPKRMPEPPHSSFSLAHALALLRSTVVGAMAMAAIDSERSSRCRCCFRRCSLSSSAAMPRHGMHAPP